MNKSFFAKISSIVIVVLIVLTTTVTASAASIRGVYFSLNGWNGPMYVDFSGVCRAAAINFYGGGTSGSWQRSNLNGNWRQFLYGMRPGVKYTVTTGCGDNVGDTGRFWTFEVSFNGAQINARRTSVR